VRTGNEPGLNWTAVLRRRPVRIVEGQPLGGYTDLYEIICCACGDHSYLDYREVSPQLQAIRGPYPIAAGVAAYERHVQLHPTDRPFQPRRSNGDGRQMVVRQVAEDVASAGAPRPDTMSRDEGAHRQLPGEGISHSFLTDRPE
jgi:hypothetical protein